MGFPQKSSKLFMLIFFSVDICRDFADAKMSGRAVGTPPLTGPTEPAWARCETWSSFHGNADVFPYSNIAMGISHQKWRFQWENHRKTWENNSKWGFVAGNIIEQEKAVNFQANHV